MNSGVTQFQIKEGGEQNCQQQVVHSAQRMWQLESCRPLRTAARRVCIELVRTSGKTSLRAIMRSFIIHFREEGSSLHKSSMCVCTAEI